MQRSIQRERRDDQIDRVAMKKACLSLSLNNEVVQVYMLRVRRTRSYSVRQWVNKEEEETETTGVRRAREGRGPAWAVPVFSPCMGALHADALRSGTTPFLPGGRQTSARRGHAALRMEVEHRPRPPPPRPPARALEKVSLHPSVRRSIVRRRRRATGRAYAYAYACTHTHRQKKTIQKPHNPSLSPSCPSLDMPLCLICPHILLYCPLLAANSSYPSLLPSPCVFSPLLSSPLACLA